MTWQAVQANIEFFDGTQFWGIASGYSVPSQADQASILGALYNLYTNSTTARAAIDAVTSDPSTPLLIGNRPGDPGTAVIQSNLVDYDYSAIQQVYYVNDHGKLVLEKPELTIIHEILHLATGLGDLVPNVDLNSATANHEGDTLPLQNIVAQEMGFTDNIQVSYRGGLQANDARFSQLVVNFDYTENNQVDVVRFGTDGPNNLDHSTRTTELRDLFLGFEGDDTISAGDGNDYLYGGAGNDIMYGGNDDDVMQGEDDNDLLYGGLGKDKVTGGDGNDVISGAYETTDYFDSARDVLDGGAGVDTYIVSSGGYIWEENAFTDGQTYFGAVGYFDLSEDFWAQVDIITVTAEDILKIDLSASAPDQQPGSFSSELNLTGRTFQDQRYIDFYGDQLVFDELISGSKYVADTEPVYLGGDIYAWVGTCAALQNGDLYIWTETFTDDIDYTSDDYDAGLVDNWVQRTPICIVQDFQSGDFGIGW